MSRRKKKNKGANQSQGVTVLPAASSTASAVPTKWENSTDKISRTIGEVRKNHVQECHSGKRLVWHSDGFNIYAGGTARGLQLDTIPDVVISPGIATIDKLATKVDVICANQDVSSSLLAKIQGRFSKDFGALIRIECGEGDAPEGLDLAWWIELADALVKMSKVATVGADTPSHPKRDFSVLVCCVDGHGRTGVILTALLYVFGVEDPIGCIRKNYCYKAIETNAQLEYLRGLGVPCDGYFPSYQVNRQEVETVKSGAVKVSSAPVIISKPTLADLEEETAGITLDFEAYELIGGGYFLDHRTKRYVSLDDLRQIAEMAGSDQEEFLEVMGYTLEEVMSTSMFPNDSPPEDLTLDISDEHIFGGYGNYSPTLAETRRLVGEDDEDEDPADLLTQMQRRGKSGEQSKWCS